jgi:hypothetical protein
LASTTPCCTLPSHESEPQLAAGTSAARRRMTPGLRSMCAIVCAAAVQACEAPGNPRLAALVSPGGTYEVRLSGRATRAALFEHRVHAEVYKNGSLHLPSRILYAAGFLDTAFEVRFGKPEWIAANVLRFPAKLGPGVRAPDTLVVRNVASQTVRSIRIETGREIFMVLDLPAGASTTMPLATPLDLEDSTWFDVLVDSGSMDTLMRGHGTFKGSGDNPRLTIVVTVSAEGVEVTPRTAATSHLERLRTVERRHAS